MRLRSVAAAGLLVLIALPARAQSPSPDASGSPEADETEPAQPDPLPVPSTAPSAVPPPPVVVPPTVTSPAAPPAAPPRTGSAPLMVPPRTPPAAAGPAAAPPSVATPSPPADLKKEEDDPDGIFGPFRIGPVVGLGVPNLLSFGVTTKLTRFLGFGVNVGIIPKVHVALYGDATLSYQEYDAYGRLYPFGGSFFLGAGAGYATTKGTFSKTVTVPDSAGAPYAGQVITLDSSGEVRSLVLVPQIGFFKTYGGGFSIGIDLGAQVPIAPSNVGFGSTSSVDGNAQAKAAIQDNIADGDGKVRETLDRIGQQIVPTVSFKIGFLL